MESLPPVRDREPMPKQFPPWAHRGSNNLGERATKVLIPSDL
jgi:hypothetical protein